MTSMPRFVTLAFMKLLFALLSAALLAQTVASVAGTVRNARGQLVANADVELKAGSQTFTAKTGSDGHYAFPAIPAAKYILRAQFTGQGEATIGPFELAANQAKQVDLTLAAAQPEFFDQPSFIVAGVTDGSNRGGHGSDAILRSSEALTKAVASLGPESHANAEPLEAVRQFQRAAELDPSEPNLFEWGAELLAHLAYDPAIEIFARGHRQFPRSTRMLLGLAVAQYSKGSYDEAADRFFEATDLDPSAPAPYLFLGKTQNSTIGASDAYLSKMTRFNTLQPSNALGCYYRAVSSWKHKASAAEVQALLEKALHLDPTLASARLELGIILADQKQFPEAVAAFEKAIEIDRRLEEAYYRLAQVYLRTGESAKAQKEFELHHQLVKESSAQVERERREVQQFVIELRRP
jgi:tetratricopeptide (TPR) repeat protein